MDNDLVTRAQWGDLRGQQWGVLARLSTPEDEDDELMTDQPPQGRKRPSSGQQIKSTEEQDRDGRALVEQRGGTVVYTYWEPDTSAWKKRRTRLPDGRVVYRVVRPVYEGALEDLKAGRAPNGERMDGLVVADIDRLTRDPRHLEDAIDVVAQFRRPIIDITGSLDLLTDNGRAVARMVVSMANKQSADTARRVRRSHTARQREGIPTGGPRPFGWETDKRTLRREEAELIRAAGLRILAGAAPSAIAAQWNRDGVLTAQGRKWNPSGVKRTLRNPRVAGYRARKVDEINPETGAEHWHWEFVLDETGERVMGQWEAIFTPEQWEALIERLGDTTTPGQAFNTRKYLSSGTLRCDKNDCGTPLQGKKAQPSMHKPEGYFYYLCPSVGLGGCGGIRIPGPETDEAVRELVIAKWEEEAAARQAVAAAVPDVWEKEGELARVREDIEEAKEARQRRILTKERYFALLQQYTTEERRLERERNRWLKQKYGAQGKPVDLRADWEGLTLHEQRSYVEQTLTAVLVAPAIGRGRPVFPRLTPLYRTEEDDQTG